MTVHIYFSWARLNVVTHSLLLVGVPYKSGFYENNSDACAILFNDCLLPTIAFVVFVL